MTANIEHPQPALRMGLVTVDDRQRYAIDARDWMPMKIGEAALPGFFWIPVSGDESGAWASYWMKLEPGARSVMHRHGATELLLILEGVFSDADGADYHAGEVVTYAAGSTHSSYSATGCIVLVVTAADSRVAA